MTFSEGLLEMSKDEIVGYPKRLVLKCVLSLFVFRRAQDILGLLDDQ
jgi:hypothetical protein